MVHPIRSDRAFGVSRFHRYQRARAERILLLLFLFFASHTTQCYLLCYINFYRGLMYLCTVNTVVFRLVGNAWFGYVLSSHGWVLPLTDRHDDEPSRSVAASNHPPSHPRSWYVGWVSDDIVLVQNRAVRNGGSRTLRRRSHSLRFPRICRPAQRTAHRAATFPNASQAVPTTPKCPGRSCDKIVMNL